MKPTSDRRQQDAPDFERALEREDREVRRKLGRVQAELDRERRRRKNVIERYERVISEKNDRLGTPNTHNMEGTHRCSSLSAVLRCLFGG
ncbi:MAG: hypothetical protein ABEJ58_07850 [Halodesulfurarchaeum sp.]